MPSVAGDIDYDPIAACYATQRRADPRLAARIHAALGSARTVLNVGAGTGSYEPVDRHVIAIEPAESMRGRRPSHLAPALRARAESIPLDDASVDASMAVITVHQWQDLAGGLGELRRVTRGPIVVVAFDNAAAHHFWLTDYVPELLTVMNRRDPAIDLLVEHLSTVQQRACVDVLHVPIDCVDGFIEAYYARPEMFLNPAVMQTQSVWSFIPQSVRERFLGDLAADLRSGRWDELYGHWRTQPEFAGSLRLIVGGQR